MPSVQEELASMPKGHKLYGCTEHECCRRYTKYYDEWTEIMGPETEAYRASTMITAEDLAIVINARDY